ncbi:reverse transcriptase [Elysia marginata]|uniref:Reverse transcriptase n=1 Tax=Elysia marginata TaxID=1093978 RepID=A0AAV4I2K3_9GAST|nr:reverse transcriptase [Elysia marginata]
MNKERIRGSSLTWFESYLTNRQQTVVTGQYRSLPVTLRYGVPQGSVLGPVLFSLYAQPFTDIFDTHGFSYHIYADDSQLYRLTQVNDISVVIQSLNECVIDVSEWMAANKLKLNEEKTDIIIIGTESKLRNIEIQTVNSNNQELMIGNKVKNLGVFNSF